MEEEKNFDHFFKPVSKKEAKEFIREFSSVFENLENNILIYVRNESYVSAKKIFTSVSENFSGGSIEDKFNEVTRRLIRQGLLLENEGFVKLTEVGFNLFDELPIRYRLKPYSYFALQYRRKIMAERWDNWYKRHVLILLIVGWLVALLSVFVSGTLNRTTIQVQTPKPLLIRDTLYILERTKDLTKHFEKPTKLLSK